MLILIGTIFRYKMAESKQDEAIRAQAWNDFLEGSGSDEDDEEGDEKKGEKRDNDVDNDDASVMHKKARLEDDK